MTDNRYSPPQGAIEDDLISEALQGSGTFELEACLADGWKHTWSSFPLWLGVGVTFIVLYMLSAVTIVGLIFLLPHLFWGGVLFCLNVRDGRESFSDLFSGFSRYWFKLRVMVVLFILVGLIGAPGTIGQLIVQGDATSVSRVGLGYLVALAWSFLVTIRVYFSFFFAVDREMGALQAIQSSWRLTSGLHVKLILLVLTTFAVALAGTVALLIGLIPATMMIYMMWVSAYRQVAGGGAS